MSADLPDDLEAAGVSGDDVETLSFEPDRLDGHTIDELADYLDAGMTPADPTIDDSPACQNALDALTRVRMLSHGALEADALDEDVREDDWITEIITNISLEAHAGRDIPLPPLKETENSVITEGAVRSIVRRSGDTVDGVLIGRCTLEGDVTTPGAPVVVRVWARIIRDHGATTNAVTEAVCSVVEEALRTHTEMNVESIDVMIRSDGAAPVREEER
ncbi:hypothetical protein [Frigoribacterium sp. PhB116]|uniref:hypothetical protein n=1 Tax=Frigoribacterium sp. PhB116 TaxID=2485174 RepID=UPI00105FF81A|nr:hypothetical protein [Frigoribacterium sp. PhB116]TDT61469.1 hypothetical protein EDF20_3126 [Frigoribacterium sp. PhB116]